MDFDLENLMLKLLERQKEYVREDRQDYSTAMVVLFTVSGESFLMFPRFEDERSKMAEYSAIVERATECGATLIVTVNAAWMSSDESIVWEHYHWGDLDATNSHRIVLLTAAGHGVRPCVLTQKFAFSGDEVEFEEPRWEYGMEINLLSDWPERRVQCLPPIN
jgi:hypothetical protein